MNEFIPTFILFFAVIDPIGTIPVFLAVSHHYSISVQRKIAIKAIWVSALILLFFVIAGEIILHAIGIPLSAFQIAGGLILFAFAFSMIFGDGKPEQEIKMTPQQHNSYEPPEADIAIFPLAIPSIASPGAMLTAVLQTKNDIGNFMLKAKVVAIIMIVLLVTLLLMFIASSFHRLLGHSGAGIISRVMGLILASVAISNVLQGFKDYFNI